MRSNSRAYLRLLIVVFAILFTASLSTTGALARRRSVTVDLDGKERGLLGTKLSKGGVGQLRWGPSGYRLASGGRIGAVSHQLRVWNLRTGRVVRSAGYASLYKWSPCGRFIAYRALYHSKSVKILSVRTGKVIHTFRTNAAVSDFSWSPQTKYIAIGLYRLHYPYLRGVRIYSIRTGMLVRSIDRRGESVAWSPNGKYLATTDSHSGSYINVWNVITGQKLYSLHPGNYFVYHRGAQWNPSGTLVCPRQFGRMVFVYNAATGRVARHATTRSSLFLNRMIWSPTGNRLASGGGFATSKIVVVWAPSASSRLHLLRHPYRVSHKSWSPNGKCLAVTMKTNGNFPSGVVWDVTTKKALARLHRGRAHNVAWSPGGGLIATAYKGGIKFWDPDVLHLSKAVCGRGKVVWTKLAKQRLRAHAGLRTRSEIT